jgi:hypothetical protein
MVIEIDKKSDKVSARQKRKNVRFNKDNADEEVKA